jgi:hypothetical protein
MRTARGGFRDLPLFWKLLVPYFTLIVIIGVLGGVPDRARAVRSGRGLHQRGPVTPSLAANAGCATGSCTCWSRGLRRERAGDGSGGRAGRSEGRRLLASVLALKTDLSLAVATTRTGRGLAEFVNPSAVLLRPPRRDAVGCGAFVAKALNDPAGNKAAGFLEVDGTHDARAGLADLLQLPECSAVGVAIVGMSSDRLLTSPPRPREVDGVTSETGRGVYDRDGERLAPPGTPVPDGRPRRHRGPPGPQARRERGGSGGDALHAAAGPGSERGDPRGLDPHGDRLRSVRSAALRLALIVLAAMLGIVGIGAVLSRYILGQVRPLLDALTPSAPGTCAPGRIASGTTSWDSSPTA